MSYGFSPSPLSALTTYPNNPAPPPQLGVPVQQPGHGGLRGAMLHLRQMEMVKTMLPTHARSMQLDDVIMYSTMALDHIGNKYYAQYILVAEADHKSQLDLPDQCHDIDYIVALGGTPYGSGSATSFDEQVWMAAQPLRAATAPATASASPIPAEGGGFAVGNRWAGWPGAWNTLQATWGRPLDAALCYEGGPMRLQLPIGTGLVLLSYKGRIVDEHGAPLITPKEAQACAKYCAFVDAHDQYMRKQMTKDMRDAAEMMWNQSISSASCEGLGDLQTLARLADTMTSMHRHLYGSPIKLS